MVSRTYSAANLSLDNYQGEESDIVIVSLTRSNADGTIGFLAARERLVVLASRARKQLVLFGNMNTLLKSKKGAELWKQFLGALKDTECLHDGVPVFCERHPERRALLKHPEDFDKNCPDGGCSEPWLVFLFSSAVHYVDLSQWCYSGLRHA